MKWYPVNEECVVNSAGVEYEDLACTYPILGYTIPNFEKRYHEQNYSYFVGRRDWMVENPMVPIYAVLAYGAFIVLGQKYFSTRKPWNWRGTMALWNLALSVFSAIGFIRTAPRLVSNLLHYSVTENFCFDPEAHYGSGNTGYWVQLFVLSKFPELIDTFFIVIHKKNLIFLHWYHHISVLLYCWNAYVTKSPAGLIFCVMNYAVHSIMYFYYFLMAVHCKPKFFNALYITIAQISQMVVGVGVTITGCYILWSTKRNGASCWLNPGNNTAALYMYGSYLCLFLEFFIKRYLRIGNGKGKGQSAQSAYFEKQMNALSGKSSSGVKVE